MKWMDAAWAELGEQEVSGRDANPKILSYFKEVGHPEITTDETAWCAAFAGRCLEIGGVNIQGIPLVDRLLANSYLKIGTPITEPRTGAICVLSRGSDPEQGHVGFVAGWTAEEIVLLGGNQADRVSTCHFPRSRIRGLRWPEPITAKQLDAQGSRITSSARRNQVDTSIAALLEALKNAAPSLGSRGPLLIAAVQAFLLLGVLYRSGLIRIFRAEDASTGKTGGAG